MANNEEFRYTVPMKTKSISKSEATFLKNYDASKFVRPSVTIDVVIFSFRDTPPKSIKAATKKELQVLLIKRAGHPFRGYWALPGGFVEMNENLDDAAKRELAEETGLENVCPEQLYTWGDVDRDPRTRVISCSYMAIVHSDNITLQAGSDAKQAKWIAVSKLRKLKLAFDHQRIIEYAVGRLHNNHNNFQH